MGAVATEQRVDKESEAQQQQIWVMLQLGSEGEERKRQQTNSDIGSQDHFGVVRRRGRWTHSNADWKLVVEREGLIRKDTTDGWTPETRERCPQNKALPPLQGEEGGSR